MRLSFVAIMFALIALAGCATTGTNQAQVERITPEELAKILPPPIATVSLEEIVADSKHGKTPDEIIEKIKASNSRYELTPSQTLDLSNQGVSTKVLDYIHQSNELAKQNAIADELNKREKEKRIAQERLQQERDYARDLYGYPYGFGIGYPYYGSFYYGYPYWRYPYGRRR
jgi:hypothetical protein